MNRPIKCATTLALCWMTTVALAIPPKQLITNNTTDAESNAYIAGTITSQYPTRAHSTNKVFWTAVKLACFGHIIDGKCSALIRMDTNTENPIDIGTLAMDITTGDITPSSISGNGYTITVTGPGETTISKD